jgi:MFS superfamily sulfate permease-like transporter
VALAITFCCSSSVSWQSVLQLMSSTDTYTVSTNRELVALGLSNPLCCFFGPNPTFGSLTRLRASAFYWRLRGWKELALFFVTLLSTECAVEWP